MSRWLALPLAIAIPMSLLGGSGNALADVQEDGVTIAFVGDQGAGGDARDVLELVAGENPDLLVLLGDYGYERGKADNWIRNLERMLEPDLPVLGVVGNHEEYQWPTYRNWLVQRAAHEPELDCTGDPGVKAHCTFHGVSILQSAPGVHEVAGVDGADDYAGYIAQTLADDPNRWRICSWHKNQRDMQIGGKGDETGWAVYEACREGGGIVASAHEHSYSRTFLMDGFEEHDVVHRQDHLEINRGRSFAFVSGLGGVGIRDQETGGDWWAAAYSSTQAATYGALFCTFLETEAACRFVDVAGDVHDAFTLESDVVPLGGRASPGARVTDGWSTLLPESSSGLGVAGPWTLLLALATLGQKCLARLLERGRRGRRATPSAQGDESEASPRGYRAGNRIDTRSVPTMVVPSKPPALTAAA